MMEGKMAEKGCKIVSPYSFLSSCFPQCSYNGKILNYAFRVDRFARTGLSAMSG